MDWLSSSDAIEVLVFLLPGFVAVSVFYSFTSHPQAKCIRTYRSIFDIYYNSIDYIMVF